MKLYVIGKNSRKIYLNKVASSRTELRQVLGKDDFYINDEKFFIRDVIANKDSNDTYTGLLVGGILGIFGGPFGIVIGGVVGAVLGCGVDSKKNINIKQFNRSKNKWKVYEL